MSAETAAHPAPRRRSVALGALWFGLFGAPAVWSLQLLLNYALVSHSCFPGSHPRTTPTFGGLWIVVLLAGVVAAIVALAAGATAWRSWRVTREEHEGAGETLSDAGERRTRFMALAGLLLSALFLLGVVLNTLPLFIVAPCG